MNPVNSGHSFPTRLSHGTSGALREFAGWVARGSVGYPLFDQGRPEGNPDSNDYRDTLKAEPSAMEFVFAIFANNLELDEAGEPLNAKYAERRAAAYLHQYMTGEWPSGLPPLGDGEADLY